MATTPNFGWTTPNDTDYVKDGASAIRTLGNAIDASMADLEGGTTGQVLSKNTNADMDFVWVTPNDADAIQNTIVDAKADLITATAADTPARLAVGTNGQVLTADSTTATGLKWATAPGGWTEISSTSLTGNSVTISSIPATYKSLRLVLRDYSLDTDAGIQMRLNGITSGTYSTMQLYDDDGTAGTATTYRYVNETKIYLYSTTIEADTGFANHCIVDFPDYSSSNSYMMGLINHVYRTSSGNETMLLGNFAQLSGAAVSSITLITTAGNFDEGTAVLYGI